MNEKGECVEGCERVDDAGAQHHSHTLYNSESEAHRQLVHGVDEYGDVPRHRDGFVVCALLQET